MLLAILGFIQTVVKHTRTSTTKHLNERKTNEHMKMSLRKDSVPHCSLKGTQHK